jgi:predicted dehydrogenase
MKAAISGAGAAGLLHALSFRAHDVAVDQVFDPDPRRAQDLASLCGARAFDTFDALAESDADCVSITSPPRWHVEQAESCAREGRTVFVEKPVAIAEDEPERLMRLPGCVPIVQWRAGRAIRAIRRAISDGLFGRSPSACVDLALHRTHDAATRARLEAMEQTTRGHTAAPLLVPYLGDAIRALREGHLPGTCDALPAIGDVAAAHYAAIRASAREGTPAAA